MTERKKNERRVSFACETPEHNVYEREMTSVTLDDISADITYNQTKVRHSFYDMQEDACHSKDSTQVQGVINDSMNESMSKCMNESMNDRMSKCMSDKRDGSMNDENNNVKDDSSDNNMNVTHNNNEQDTLMNTHGNNNEQDTLMNTQDNNNDQYNIQGNIQSNDQYNIQNNDQYNEQDTLMSNTTIVFDELVNTQYIRTIVPPINKTKVNVNEMLMEKGIRFLDDIVVSSTRRETISKSRKDVNPVDILYYKYYLTHRIKFFDDFSEFLKDKLHELGEEITRIENSFDIKGTLLEKEDKSMLRNLKTDCRNRANVFWYEIRTKKELEFNEKVINLKNELLNSFSTKENEYKKLVQRKECLTEEYNDIVNKTHNIKMNDSDATEETIKKMQRDVLDNEKVLQEYEQEYEVLKIEDENKKMSDIIMEKKYEEIKNEIQRLEKQYKNTPITENDLNEARSEYEKVCSILGVNILEYNRNRVVLTFLGYNIRIQGHETHCTYVHSKSIIHDYGVYLVNSMSGMHGGVKEGGISSCNGIGGSSSVYGGSSSVHGGSSSVHGGVKEGNVDIQDIITKENTLHIHNMLHTKDMHTKDMLHTEDTLHIHNMLHTKDTPHFHTNENDECMNTYKTRVYGHIKCIVKVLNVIHEMYKEVCSIKENNKIEVYIQNDNLYLSLSIYDTKTLNSYKVNVKINKHMDVLIEKNNEEYLYNMYTHKGVISNHICM